MGLERYRQKRDFAKTAEPSGAAKSLGRRKAKVDSGTGATGATGANRSGRFVIQKHAASRLHYDLRLEMEGVLKSWAVPKGMPYKLGEKRLAVHVEDHPLEYAGFEGTIPEGEYGAGTVMVWDCGRWESLGGNGLEDLEAGKLHFALEGEKLRGEWTLVRTQRRTDWLVIKTGEAVRKLSKKEAESSAQSKRTMEEIAGHGRQWSGGKAALGKSAPKFITPMLCKPVAAPPKGDGWIYELKFDGYRAVAVCDGGDWRLWSRNGKVFGDQYAAVVDALKTLPVKRAVLDGELVALDKQGHSNFQLLQQYEIGGKDVGLCYYCFDLMNLQGVDLVDKPLWERKKRLADLLGDGDGGDVLRFSADILGDPDQLLAVVGARGLEGIIGKQKDAVYESGRRSGAWVKVKCVRSHEFIIGGYTEPARAREEFGALLVGYYDGNKLKFAGKVGTGFSGSILRDLHSRMDALGQKECPFADLPAKRQGRWNQNLTPASMARCHWTKPELVCEVKFTEWTADGKLRHPVYLGLRVDKEAGEVKGGPGKANVS